MPTPGIVLVTFYKGASLPDEAVRIDTCRPDQGWENVPSHCAIVLPPLPGRECGNTDAEILAASSLYEMVAAGWIKRELVQADLAWCFSVSLPNPNACRVWCEANRGRYRWWVDALILVMSRHWVRNNRVPPLLHRWHLAVRHICSVDAAKALEIGGWVPPAWLTEQDCPISPNDLLYAVRETLRLPQSEGAARE